MSSKTRKFIWSVPVMAAFAVIGALAAFGVLGLQNAEPVEAAGEPGAPTAITSVSGNGSATLRWTTPAAGVSAITHYEVQYIVDSDLANAETVTVVGALTGWLPAEPLRTTGPSTFYRITGLTNGTAYHVQVRAVNTVVGQDGGTGDWGIADADSTTGDVQSVVPAASAPSAPRNVAVQAKSDTELTVSWSAPANNGGSPVTGYQVSTDGGTNWGTALSVTTFTTDVGSLTAQTDYKVVVRAVNIRGDGAASAPAVTVTTKRASSVAVEVPAVIAGLSTSPNGKADISLDINLLAGASLAIGGSVVLFLEDDFRVPDAISTADVFFTSAEAPSGGAPINASRVVVNRDDFRHTGLNAHTIRAYLPDMDLADNANIGIDNGESFTLRITKEAGITSDTQAGTYEVAYQLLTPAESINADFETALPDVVVTPKVKLSDIDNKRDYELTIIGSGLNSGRNGTAYVLENYTGSTTPTCEMIIADGASVGSGVVGSDHSVTIVDTVTTDHYSAGQTNYICVRDDNSPTRRSTNVEPFNMEASIAASPDTVNSGDEVTVTLRDFNVATFGRASVLGVSLGGKKAYTSDTTDVDDFPIDVNADDNEITFDMPGGLSGNVEISVNVATVGGNTAKQATVTVNPSSLTLSSTSVAPYESVIISGSGFNEDAYICVDDIQIDDRALVVDLVSCIHSSPHYPGAFRRGKWIIFCLAWRGTTATVSTLFPMNYGYTTLAGTSRDDSADIACDDPDPRLDRYLSTTSNGEFTATVRIWSNDSSDNPALSDDEYTIKVTDISGFEGKATITILEPTVSVNPAEAHPRDFITITGENWPVSTSEIERQVTINISEGDAIRTTTVDSTGRFNIQYQLGGRIAIGESHKVVVSFNEGGPGDIEEEASFSVPDANMVLSPTQAVPGDRINIELYGMPILQNVDSVFLGGRDRLDIAVNTDGDGNAVIEGLLVPYLEAGFYPVTVKVDTETRVEQLEILAEATVTGTATAVADALAPLGESLVRVFHFNNTSKVWTFYDPRPEFDGLNTLSELANGQPYWVLVSEGQENVVLNGQTRNLTCSGGDCWNLEVW